MTTLSLPILSREEKRRCSRHSSIHSNSTSATATESPHSGTFEDYERQTSEDGSPIVLGEGSFGKVFRGYHTPTSTVCAIKETWCHNGRRLTDEEAQLFPGASENCSAEMCYMLIAKEVAPKVLDYCAAEDRVGAKEVLVMEFCEGGDLQTIVERDGPLTEAEAFAIARKLLEILSWLHCEKQLVHGDVKPCHVFFRRENDFSSLCLVDWGSAAALQHDVTVVEVPTTEHYTAPEVCCGTAYTTKAEAWAAGATIAFMLTGNPPSGDVSITMGNLVRDLCHEDPAARINCKDALDKYFGDAELTSLPVQ